MVEIAGLTEHLLTECEVHGNFGKCPRCTEAIATTELEQHVKEKTCARTYLPRLDSHLSVSSKNWSNVQ